MIKDATLPVTVRFRFTHSDKVFFFFLHVIRVGCFYASEETDVVLKWINAVGVLIPRRLSVRAEISLRSITAITDRSFLGSLLCHLLSKDSVTCCFLSLRRTSGWDFFFFLGLLSRTWRSAGVEGCLMFQLPLFCCNFERSYIHIINVL